MNSLAIDALDPLNVSAVDGAYDVIRQSTEFDMPQFPVLPKTQFLVRLVRPTADRTWHRLIAIRDDEVVAMATLMMPQSDNRHLVEIELDVVPQHRRRGIGSALLAEAEKLATDNGRTVHLVYIVDQYLNGPHRPDGGQRFAERFGYVKSQYEVHSRADLTSITDTQLEELSQEAWTKADGYEVVQWNQHAPAEIVDDVAYLEGRMVDDSPMGEVDMESENVDAARMRDRERNLADRGSFAFNTAVRHIASGRVVGYTSMSINAGDEENLWQGTTLVDPQHRGHRLGLILKIENHRQAKRMRPLGRYVHTWNAEDNDFMIRINKALDYRVVDCWIAYQRTFS